MLRAEQVEQLFQELESQLAGFRKGARLTSSVLSFTSTACVMGGLAAGSGMRPIRTFFVFTSIVGSRLSKRICFSGS
jgi:hypothetical protein